MQDEISLDGVDKRYACNSSRNVEPFCRCRHLADCSDGTNAADEQLPSIESRSPILFLNLRIDQLHAGDVQLASVEISDSNQWMAIRMIVAGLHNAVIDLVPGFDERR